MERQESSRLYYALLIGIDGYDKEPLEGAVRDVKAIKAYLESRHDPVLIRTLTATSQGRPDTTTPAEDSGSWPTYENVTAALDNITARAEPGDCAYIHFSGHGTRMDATRAFANEATGELALNLLVSDGREIRYLRGVEFAALLTRIVAKGVLVTVVLDCCFSGSVLRRDDGCTVRELRYDPTIDERYPADPVLLAELPSDLNLQVHRDGGGIHNWLVNPDGYTIMAACGPHELAHEEFMDDGEKYGRLSYVILKTLAMWEGTRTPQLEIYRHICATFQERWPHQNPMLFGNKSLSFFADHNSPADDSHSFVVLAAEAGMLLQLGRAHGVSEGDIFSLFSTRSATGTGTVVETSVRVETAGNLTSRLSFLDSAGGNSVRTIQTGWGAKQITRGLLRQVPIGIAPELGDLAQIFGALQSRPSLNAQVCRSSTDVYSFRLTINADENYIILDGRDRELLNVPSISVHADDSIPRLLDILEHLTKFKLVKGLENKDPFEDSFEAQLITPTGDLRTGEVGNLKTGDQVVFKVENKSRRTLYIHIYDMGPRWNVQNITRDEYRILPPRNPAEGYMGVLRAKFWMELPAELREAGQEVCEDVFKVFITTRRTSFLSLELPKLSGSAAKLEIPPRTRASPDDVEDDLIEDWATLEFTLRISAN